MCCHKNAGTKLPSMFKGILFWMKLHSKPQVCSKPPGCDRKSGTELQSMASHPHPRWHSQTPVQKYYTNSTYQNHSNNMVLCGGLVCWCLHTLRIGLSIFVKTCCQCLTCLQWNDWLMALQDAFQGVFTFKRIIFRTCYIVQCWIQARIFGDCSKKTARLSRRFHQFRPWKFASAEGVESIPPYIAASNGRASTTVHLCPLCSPPRTPFCGHFLTHKWHDGSAQLGTTFFSAMVAEIS